ncbi:NADP-dependent oxidoreductase domain-containing protein [Gautieria morchelliformis]|nr:NADP-dependent oxidoreductase domain-containing protein [Gautieria morchelliformis]
MSYQHPKLKHDEGATSPTSSHQIGPLSHYVSHAEVRVSPLQLGAASIGDKWSGIMGSMDKESSLSSYSTPFMMPAQGNFIDTANSYQDETSEKFIGDWMGKRGIRDQMKADSAIRIQMNYTSNSHKSLHMSVEASLKKLRTTYIDILYVHWWSFDTSAEEVMNSLHSLVDTPAWVVFHGKTPFCIYQGKWSILERSFERDIIPMAKSGGLALAPWELWPAQTDDGRRKRRRKESGEGGRTAANQHKLEEIAKEVGTQHITAVAVAYVMHAALRVLLIGGRKVEHLHDNFEALDIKLTPAQVKAVEEVLPFNEGYPKIMVWLTCIPTG